MRPAIIWTSVLGVGALAVVAYFVWSWHFSLPLIARDLPSNVREADSEFKRRVTARYAVGLKEEDLVRELRDDGFGQPKGGLVEIARGLFPCNHLWRVFWQTKDGRAVEINGLYGQICL